MNSIKPFIYTSAEDAFWYVEDKLKREDLTELEGTFSRPDDSTFLFHSKSECDEPETLDVLFYSSPKRFFPLLRCLASTGDVVRLKLENISGNIYKIIGFFIIFNTYKIDNEYYRFIVNRLDIGDGGFKREPPFKNSIEVDLFYHCLAWMVPTWVGREYRRNFKYIDQEYKFEETLFNDKYKAICMVLMGIEWHDKPYLPRDVGRARACIDKYLAHFEEERMAFHAKIDRAIEGEANRNNTCRATQPGEVNSVFICPNGSAEVITISCLEKPGMGEVKLLGAFEVANREYAEIAGLVAAIDSELDLSASDLVFYASSDMRGSDKKNTIGCAVYASLLAMRGEITLDSCAFIGAVNARGVISIDLNDDQLRASLKALHDHGIKKVFGPRGMAQAAVGLGETFTLEVFEATNAADMFEIAAAIGKLKY